MLDILHDIRVFGRFVAKRLVQDRCVQTAASLAFTTLLSLVPIVTIALTVFSASPVFANFWAQIKTYLLTYLMPEKAGIVITQYMQQFAESATRLTAVGLVLLAVTALSMMLTMENAFNVIWRVSRPRPLFKRLVAYSAVLTLGPLLIGASLSLTSWLVGLSMGHGERISVFGIMALKILPILFSTLAFTLLFQLVPNRQVPLLHAVTGALFAAMTFEATSRVFGYFISHFPTYNLVYGAFASLPIFLMWIFLSWLTVLFGAVIAASLSSWRAPAPKVSGSEIRLLDALRVLQALMEGSHKGSVGYVPELSKSLLLGYDALERTLEELASMEMVRKVKGNGWIMIRDAHHIRVSELVRFYVMNRDVLPAGNSDEPLARCIARWSEQLEDLTDIPLQALLHRNGN